jgi:hypothetical protein
MFGILCLLVAIQFTINTTCRPALPLLSMSLHIPMHVHGGKVVQLVQSINDSANSTRRRKHTYHRHRSERLLAILLLLLSAGDIEQNPGPGNSIYPCGLCDFKVSWNCPAVACDGCEIWYHKSCLEMNSQDYDLLGRSHVQWICYKCDSINCASFTFHNYEIENTSNYYMPLSGMDTTRSSTDLDSNMSFNPLFTSSPVINTPTTPHRGKKGTSTVADKSSSIYNLPKKTNVRIMNINCQSVANKSSELQAVVDYVKPDIVCGTESWLTKDHRSGEVFQQTSLDKLNKSPNLKNILLAGDFNCPDITWDTSDVRPSAPQRNVQEELINVTEAAHLTQVHREPTRGNEILDLVFTSNPSLVKN